MNNKLLFIFFPILLTACSKDATVDPRDQYVGDYTVIYKATGTSANGTPITINQAGAMSVVKGAEPNAIGFVEGSKYLTATLSGSAFTLEPVVSPIDKDYVTTGNGTFTKNSFTMKSLGKGGKNYPTEITLTGTRK